MVFGFIWCLILQFLPVSNSERSEAICNIQLFQIKWKQANYALDGNEPNFACNSQVKYICFDLNFIHTFFHENSSKLFDSSLVWIFFIKLHYFVCCCVNFWLFKSSILFISFRRIKQKKKNTYNWQFWPISVIEEVSDNGCWSDRNYHFTKNERNFLAEDGKRCVHLKWISSNANNSFCMDKVTKFT